MHRVVVPSLLAVTAGFVVQAAPSEEASQSPDFAGSAKSLKQPMPILQGQRDYQVTMQDFDGWKQALSSREDVRFKLYPKCNHLFAEGAGLSTPAEYQKPGNVAKSVIDDIARWIAEQ